ncbi:MAG: AMP-binding protein [Acidobacteriota bacterium]|nr:AMP-binding protein [Acidobacteriota bacterium]
MNSVGEYLKGKTLFITGATGFLGQCLVEKILWSVPGVKRVYVLIRPRTNLRGAVVTARMRLERELCQASCFDRLRSRLGDDFPAFLKEKLVPVSGDLSRDDLNIDEETRQRLQSETDVVINSAAVVSFDAPLDEAYHLNVLGAQRVARFAQSCDDCVLVHVSTAYVCGAVVGSVPETIPEAPAGGGEPFPARAFSDVDLDIERIEKILDSVRERAYAPEREREFAAALLRRFKRSKGGRNVRRREKIENLRKKWIQNELSREGMSWARERGWNDTYTYTKSIGERIVLRTRNGAPTIIIRPAVIESGFSEPSPGWLEGLRMADPLIAAIGKGRLRALPLSPKVIIDLVPVDMVVNALLASLPAVSNATGVQIYQVATGSCNPITLGYLYDLIYRYFKRNPMFDKAGRPINIRYLRFPKPAIFRLQHRLKALPLNLVSGALDKLSELDSPGGVQRYKRRLSALKAAHEKLYYYGEIYEPYLNLNCRFGIENTMGLLDTMSQEEREAFNFDVTRLNWRHYIQNIHIPGVKKFILKMEGAGTLEPNVQPSGEGGSVSTINDLLAYSVSRYSAKTALQMQRNGEWIRYTYSDLQRRAATVGRQLRTEGLAKGDRVVLFAENQPDWGVAYLGAASQGLVVVPLDSQSWHREVWSVARFTGARAILASARSIERLPPESMARNESGEAPIRILNINELAQPFGLPQYPRSTGAVGPVSPPAGGRPVEVDAGDPASIIFTTTTAADPKGAVHTHSSFLSNLHGMNRYLAAEQTDQILSVLPLYHALEFTCGFLSPLFGGATVTYLHSLKPRVILKTMRETGTTCMLGVPSLYALIRDDINRRTLRASKSSLKSNLVAKSRQLSKSIDKTFGKNLGRQIFARVHQEFGGRIRAFVSGGSSLGDELYDDFKALGLTIYEGYGLTETAPVLTVNPLNRSRRGSAGKPLPGTELRIFQADDRGEGEIIVRTPSLMQGYYKNPEATRAVMRDGWFHTGDLGWVDEDGYLYITGRKKNVIVTGAGKNVYPVDLEAIYRNVPAVEDICVVGTPKGLTEDVHAVIVPGKETLRDVAAAEWPRAMKRATRALARQLPGYQRLQHIHLSETPLPRRGDGSLARDVILQNVHRSVARSRARGGRAARPRGSDVATELTRELSRISGIPSAEITPDSHLFTDVGLDSLAAMELLIQLEHRFGISLPEERVASLVSFGDLVDAVREGMAATADGAGGAPAVRSALPWSQRPSVDRAFLGLSFSALRLLYASYFRLRLRFPERLPRDEAYIIAANHSSHLDSGAIIAALAGALGTRQAKKLHLLGARDYFFNNAVRAWFFSTFLNVVPIEREETSLEGLRTIQTILQEGEPVLIFPEGTRSRTGELRSFKPGLGLIARELRVPIVPVRIDGAYQALPAGRTLPRPGRLEVTFGKPIRTERYFADGAEESRVQVYRKIADDVREHVVRMGDGNRNEPV